MPTLLLLRDRPLSEAEQKRLPHGCFPVSGSADRVVARADVRGPVSMLLFMVAKMVKAVPDADFGYEQGFGESSEESFSEDSSDWSESDEESESGVSTTESSWIAILESGRIDESVEAFLQEETMLSLQQIQTFLTSQQSHKIIFVCKIATFLQLKHVVLKLKRNLQHPEPAVKIAILNAYAVLADESIAPAIHLFLADANEQIRSAAIRAFQSIQERLSRRP